jgi:hypothetical protein
VIRCSCGNPLVSVEAICEVCLPHGIARYPRPQHQALAPERDFEGDAMTKKWRVYLRVQVIVEAMSAREAEQLALRDGTRLMTRPGACVTAAEHATEEPAR